MSTPVIELLNVYMKSDRGGHVFRDLSLTVNRGESIIVVGTAGSGKTTLVDLLLGKRTPEAGEVNLFGMSLVPRRRRMVRRVRRRIGGVGGPFDLLPSLTIADNISLPMVLTAERKKLQRERLMKMLSEFSLLKLAGKYPRHLTRVERTMALFARASVAGQPLLIVDEPLAGLDAKTYGRINDYLVREAVSGRSMVLLVSELPSGQIPNARVMHLAGGVLA